MSDTDAYWSLLKGKPVTKLNPDPDSSLTYAELEQALGPTRAAGVYTRITLNREQKWVVGDIVLAASGWTLIRTFNNEWENPFTKEVVPHESAQRPLKLIGRAM